MDGCRHHVAVFRIWKLESLPPSQGAQRVPLTEIQKTFIRPRCSSSLRRRGPSSAAFGGAAALLELLHRPTTSTKEAAMNSTSDRSVSRLAAVALAAVVTLATLAGVDGLAQADSTAHLAKTTATATRG
jgi:hypothetical protein